MSGVEEKREGLEIFKEQYVSVPSASIKLRIDSSGTQRHTHPRIQYPPT